MGGYTQTLRAQGLSANEIFAKSASLSRIEPLLEKWDTF